MQLRTDQKHNTGTHLGDRHPDFPLATYGDWDLFCVLKNTVNWHLTGNLNRYLKHKEEGTNTFNQQAHAWLER